MNEKKRIKIHENDFWSRFAKQWQRINLTYNFVRVPINVMQLLLWVFIYLELASWIEMNIFNMAFIVMGASLTLLLVGWVLDKKGVFYKYQSNVDKMQNAEVSVHRWRAAGAYFAKYQLMSEGKDTTAIDEIIRREKAWFFPMGVPNSVTEESSYDELMREALQ